MYTPFFTQSGGVKKKRVKIRKKINIVVSKTLSKMIVANEALYQKLFLQ
jgi:hypothetical protein